MAASVVRFHQYLYIFLFVFFFCFLLFFSTVKQFTFTKYVLLEIISQCFWATRSYFIDLIHVKIHSRAFFNRNIIK